MSERKPDETSNKGRSGLQDLLPNFEALPILKEAAEADVVPGQEGGAQL
jgi:hypothetical protein